MSPDQVTNQDFMRAVFHGAGPHSFTWVCSFPGDPKTASNRDWAGQSCKADSLPRLDESGNTFFNISTLEVRDGRVARKEPNFDAMHVVVLDDLGTKSCLPADFTPSYLIETSKNNFQAGLILSVPCRDLTKAKALFRALAGKRFTDIGAQGPQSRLVRLPVGVNHKGKCGPGGFSHRLTLWEPDRRFTIDEIVSHFGLDPESETTKERVAMKVAPDSGGAELVDKADAIIISKVLRSAKARRVWNCEGGDDFGSGSDADQFLLTCIAFNTESVEQVERIYSQSPRASRKSSDGSQKWIKRSDYRKRSIEAAFRFVEKHPSGDPVEARAVVEGAIAVAKASGNFSGVYAPEVLEAFSTLEKSDPGNFDNLRSGAKKAGVTLSRLDAEIVKATDAGAKLLDADAADLAIERLGGVGSILFSGGQWWQWRQERGVWIRLDGDEPIRQVILEVLPKRQVTGGAIGSVLSVLRTKAARNVEFDAGGAYLVNCANGTLELAKSLAEVLDGDGDVWRLRQHRREDYLTSRIPHSWVPHAPCPVFDGFLASIFDGDADFEVKQDLLVEGIGYSMTMATDHERFFVLYGPWSNNGKSTLLSIIEGMAGKENTAALSLKQLDERFAPAKLLGKRVNLCAEIPRGESLPDDHIKKLTSGDVITAEFKGKDHFEFRNQATLWFACNDLPNLRDLSAATLDKRCMLIELNRSFTGDERDVSLKEKMLAEIEGTFWKCVQQAGFKVLLSKTPISGDWGGPPRFLGGFLVEPPSSVAAKSEWRTASDPVALFAEDRLIASLGFFVESTALFAAWDSWAMAHGVTLKLTANHLTARLKRMFPRIETGDGARRGRQRGIGGLGLVDL